MPTKMVTHFVFYVIYGCLISLSWKIFGVHGREMQFWAILTASSLTIVKTCMSMKSRGSPNQFGLSNIGVGLGNYFVSKVIYEVYCNLWWRHFWCARARNMVLSQSKNVSPLPLAAWVALSCVCQWRSCVRNTKKLACVFIYLLVAYITGL